MAADETLPRFDAPSAFHARTARQVMECLSGSRPENVVNPAVLFGTPWAG